jgi:Glycosyl transferases group 1
MFYPELFRHRHHPMAHRNVNTDYGLKKAHSSASVMGPTNKLPLSGGKVHRAKFTRSISHFCRSQLMLFSKMKDPTPFRIVLPSYVEGVPVSAMEAMAVGVPVVATNVGGTSELISDGHSGLLIRPSDAESICDAVMKLASTPELAQSISRNGRAKVEADFDSAIEFAKLNGYFQEYGT